MSRLTSPWSYGKDIYTVDVSCLKKNEEGGWKFIVWRRKRKQKQTD